MRAPLVGASTINQSIFSMPGIVVWSFGSAVLLALLDPVRRAGVR